ncbi:MAG TPA: hypothetical protein P5102_14205 [Candidatus Competibacteraceae bacterium]|nr:hypothetical protein [Candidatus Competibacteraceae bacterium]HRZ07275.1 hypothetical protein [Candidatus Competibacteraceae bacterium]HSA45413.1 hypothetical protein [Candidatus Competibacteraceae bacterium]
MREEYDFSSATRAQDMPELARLQTEENVGQLALGNLLETLEIAAQGRVGFGSAPTARSLRWPLDRLILSAKTKS